MGAKSPYTILLLAAQPIYGLLTLVMFFTAGFTFYAHPVLGSVLMVAGVWGLWQLRHPPTYTHEGISSGVYAVHMLRPHWDRVIVVTIDGDPDQPQTQRLTLYALPSSYFVQSNLRDFIGGRGGVEMHVEVKSTDAGEQRIYIQLKRALAGVVIRRAGDPTFPPA
jgi:hypothetical protein